MEQENSPRNQSMAPGKDSGSQGIPSAHKPARSPLHILIIGFLVFIVLWVASLWMGLSWLGKGPKSEGLDALRARLVEMEGRLGRLEAGENKMASLQQDVKGLQEKMSNYQLSLNVFGDRLRRLAEESSKEPKGPAEVKGEAKVATAPQAKEQYHEVRAGETLYSISRKYGVSVTGIRELNGMKQGEPLKVGQKIKVGSLEIRKLENDKNLRQD